MGKIKNYKGVIKREEDQEDIDWSIYVPENTPSNMHMIYGCFEFEKENS